MRILITNCLMLKNLKTKIVKVIVRKKSDPKQFEKFIDKIYSVGIQDLKIVENFTITESEDFEVGEEETQYQF